MTLPAFAARWYHAALALFAIGAVTGLTVSILGPLQPMKLLGLGIVVLSGLGFAISAFGLGLESPRALRRLKANVLQRLRAGSLDAAPFGRRALQAPRVP